MLIRMMLVLEVSIMLSELNSIFCNISAFAQSISNRLIEIKPSNTILNKRNFFLPNLSQFSKIMPFGMQTSCTTSSPTFLTMYVIFLDFFFPQLSLTVSFYSISFCSGQSFSCFLFIPAGNLILQLTQFTVNQNAMCKLVNPKFRLFSLYFSLYNCKCLSSPGIPPGLHNF